ncbi:YaiO family outer membrane beta-barrel protein [Pedobacter glucosidilyticus]|uniref:YaiO family outer membrane beta-barrel protein n=1 Tax=Pedobacter glucosidilyticus TaxID=1122941 RepID=UPI0026EF2FB9|nr:YaiO family outer membrane beta-barrel protein [Pedobacter glucosidilyticus]
MQLLPKIIKNLVLLALFLFIHVKITVAQEDLSSDSLMVLAKKEAYTHNNYPAAITLLKKALIKSPTYTDVRALLGRIYTFSDQIDSAQMAYDMVLKQEPNHLDAINGLYDLYYWNNFYKQAVKAADMGIQFYPDSSSFYLKKLKALLLENDIAASSKLNNDIQDRFKSDKVFVQSAALAYQERKKVWDNPVTLSSDSLMILAKKEAYTNNNYPKAIAYMKQAVKQSPDYKDLRILLGRLYTFSDQTDSAKNEFQKVLLKQYDDIDALSGIYDADYWADRYDLALKTAELGINYHPDTALFYIRKAKVFNAQFKPFDAIDFLESNPSILKDSLARAYLDDLKLTNLRNRIGISYEYVDFDKRFDEPWHFATISYGYRSKKLGRVNTRFYYANRFDSEGLQGEIEAYPSLKNVGYQYIGIAISESPIFPRFRAGYSLFASLPKSYEAEIGFRYLRFSENTFLFTGAIGKYLGNNFYNIRSFISPGETAWSYSFTASARLFFSDDMDDFLNIAAGTGVSPDDPVRVLFINSFANLKSYKAAISYNRVLKRKHMLGLDISWVNEEYSTDTWGNQFSFGIGYSRRF